MSDGGIPGVVSAAWRAAVDHWDDPASHDRFLAEVATYSCFAWAAARYRERAGDPIADQRLERLRKAATATLLATATVRPTREATPYRNALVVLLVLVIMMAIGAVYALVRSPGP